jgi:predicted NBD/HSP70 family sugar kinase
VLGETAGYLGAGIANLINLFNPERIVLSGWAGLAFGEVLLPRIREAAAAHALRHPFGQTSIELGQLGVGRDHDRSRDATGGCAAGTRRRPAGESSPGPQASCGRLRRCLAELAYSISAH